jgi:hypothetical protein
MYQYSREEKECWFAEFITPRQYADVKIKMLQKDMYIKPSEEEIAHLYSLETQHDIDRAVASIVDRHWE